MRSECSLIKPRTVRWVGYVVRRRGEKYIKILVEKLERKRQLGRPRRRWEDNIRIDLREIGWEVVDWIHLPQVESSGGLL
jgi:hypothetical protein